MNSDELTVVVRDLITLIGEHYFDRDVADASAQALADGLAGGRYHGDEAELADAVTADLRSASGDLHLRLIYHAEPLAEREAGDDSQEYAAMARWAGQTCGGVSRVGLLDGGVGHVDLQPVLFPVAISADAIGAAMSLVAQAQALILDLRQTLGGDPEMTAFLLSYLFGDSPVQLSALHEGREGRVRQYWTLPFVPGRRFGPAKPVYVLTSAVTFSGGEQVAYDLQQLGRARIVGERTRGGAHPREGFRVHPHLEAAIPVARAISPVSGGNWEGTGVLPDVEVAAPDALDVAHKLAKAGLAELAALSAA